MKHTILLASMIVGTACVTPGVRAGTGECPAGETCSDITPTGLYFRGTSLSRSSNPEVKVTAAGGIQTIRVLVSDDSEDPFEFPFAAEVEDDSLSVGSIAPPDLVLRGHDSGGSYLRVFDPDTGELFDKVAVQSEPVSEISVQPIHMDMTMYPDDFQGWAVYAGQPQDMVVRLHAQSTLRLLVDESMDIALDPASAASSTRVAWDRVTLSGLAPGVERLVVTTGAGVEYQGELELVAGIDSLTLAVDEYTEPIEVDRNATLCFAGASQGKLVHGLPWEFSVQGPGSLSPYFTPNCMILTAEDAGTLTVTATVLGQSLGTSVEAVPASQAMRVAPLPGAAEELAPMDERGDDRVDDRAIGAEPGQRARLSAPVMEWAGE